MRSLALAIIALLFPALAAAQVCTPTVTGFQSGPVDPVLGNPALTGALMPFDDGTGPALVAAGYFNIPLFTTASAINVGRYRNGVWSPMNAGLPIGTSRAMHALAQADFSATGGPGPSLYVAGDWPAYRWTGTSWVGSVGPNGSTYTLLSYTDAQGPVLFAGGTFGIDSWRGSGAWAPMVTNFSGTVYALRVVDDGSGPAVFAVGTIQSSSVHYVAKLIDGQWVGFPLNVFSIQSITDITSFDDGVTGPLLYITGSFSLTGVNNAGVARLRNGTWEVVGSALTVDSGRPSFFKVDEGQGEQLYVGGVFLPAGSQPIGLVKLTPSGWQPMYLTVPSSPGLGFVRAIARFHDGGGVKTYFGGTFTSFRTNPDPQSVATPAFGLMRSTPTGFEAAARGLGQLAGSPSANLRYTLASIDIGTGPQLFAGCQFARAGGQAARCAALYDGQTWTPLSLPTIGPTTQAVQYAALANIDGQQRLVAHIFGSPLGPIAYWDGAQWVRLTNQPPFAAAYGLAVLNDTLYVMGDPGLFHYDGSTWILDITGSGTSGAMIVGDIGRGRHLYATLSGPMGPGLYEYDGTTYARLGTNFSTNPSTLAIHDDGAGASIYVAGSGLPGYVARFQNNAFVSFINGISNSGPQAPALASFNDGVSPALYIAGQIVSVGGMNTNGFIRWHAGVVTNPVRYVGNQTVGIPRASLAVVGNRLYIAGEVYNIGATAADHLAYIEACPRICSADFNNDGGVGTDADIDAFFACLAGNCCATCGIADFNGDGDVGTDADIDAFFRVLGGGPC